MLGFLACSAVLRRRAFCEVGGFSRLLFFVGEERLLCYDLAAAGWERAYLHDVVAHHHTFRASLRHARGEESIGRRRLAWCGVVQEMEDLWPSGVALRGAVSNHLKLR